MVNSKKGIKKLLRKISSHNDENTRRDLSSKINIPKNGLEKFTFATHYPWLNSVEIKGFSNMLKDENEFANNVYECITKIIPIINKESDSIFGLDHKNYKFPHCHIVDEKKIDLVKNICMKMHDDDFSSATDIDSSYEWYQLGISQGIRIFGIYSKSDTTFYPLFCDWHHSIHSNIKHNQNDHKYDKFNPADRYKKV